MTKTNKTDHHDKTEILLKVALNTIKQTNKQTNDDLWNTTQKNLYNRAVFIYISFIHAITYLYNNVLLAMTMPI